MSESNNETKSAKADTQSKSKSRPRAHHRARRSGVSSWVILLLLIILAGLGYGYYYFMEHHADYKNSQDKNSQLVNMNQQQIQALMKQQQIMMQQQQQMMLQLHEGSKQSLIHANVFILLQRANLLLTVERDPNAALTFLSEALQQLNSDDKTKNNVELRNAISEDITKLRQVSTEDTTQLTNAFTGVTQSIDKLTIALPQKKAVEPEQNKNAKGWKKVWYEISDQFRDVVIVERTDKKFMPLLSKANLIVFKQYMHSLTQQALWAVLHYQPKIFNYSISQMQQALKENFPHSNLSAQRLNQELVQLKQLPFATSLPEHLTSLLLAQQQIVNNKGNAK